MAHEQGIGRQYILQMRCPACGFSTTDLDAAHEHIIGTGHEMRPTIGTDTAIPTAVPPWHYRLRVRWALWRHNARKRRAMNALWREARAGQRWHLFDHDGQTLAIDLDKRDT